MFPDNSPGEDDDAIATGEYYASDDAKGGTIWVTKGGKHGVEIANGSPMTSHKSAAQAIFKQFPNIKRVSGQSEQSVMEADQSSEDPEKYIKKAEEVVKSHKGTLVQNGSEYRITIPNLRDNLDMKMSFKLRTHSMGDLVADYEGPFTDMDYYNKSFSFVEVLPYVVKHFIKAFEKGKLTSAPPANRAQASQMGYVQKFIPRK